MSTRPGFTVVELVAALALGSVLLLTARAALAVLGDSRAAVASAATTLTHDGTGHRRLRETFLMTEAAEAGARPFFGDARSAAFRSRCRSAGGWIEPCDVSLQIVEDVGTSTVRLTLGHLSQDVMRGRGALRFRYLDGGTGVPGWRENWGVSIARPIAVAVVGPRDTVIYRGAGF